VPVPNRNMVHASQVLDELHQALGPEHPGTLVGMLNLGRTLRELGQLTEAEMILQKVHS